MNESNRHPLDEAPPVDPAFDEADTLEVARVNGIRIFKVLKSDGTEETICAHYHDTSSGTCYFVTIEAGGNKFIHHVYNPRVWDEIHEIVQAVGNVAGSKRVN